MAAEYFFPFFHVVLSESGNSTARIKVNKDMPIKVNRMFDLGQQLGDIAKNSRRCWCSK
jgi:hypothetical protein